MDVLVRMGEEIVNSEFFNRKEFGLRIKIGVEIQFNPIFDSEKFVL